MNIDLNQVPEFYRRYVEQLGDGGIVPLLLKTGDDLVSTCRDLTDAQALYEYAPEKWSIKDIIQHLIDAERVFVYRAMRFARNDQTELSGFDQNDYAGDGQADKRTVHQLLSEFTNRRASTIDFFTSLDEERRGRSGKSSGVVMSVEVLGYIISGHTVHHIKEIKEKYFK